MCCSKCLQKGWFSPFEHMHHIIYPDGNGGWIFLAPLCRTHHVEITALNIENSRWNGFRKLTNCQRMTTWNEWFRWDTPTHWDSWMRASDRLPSSLEKRMREKQQIKERIDG
jgi:hypothetical protein